MLAAPSQTPDPYERSAKSRAAMAAERGISTRQLRRRLAMERETAERAARERARREERAREDEDDLPLVALTTDPTRERGEWYLLDSSSPKIDMDGRCITSVESGRVRIGDHSGRRTLVRSVNGGAPIERTGNKSCKPDPSGLKGGKG